MAQPALPVPRFRRGAFVTPASGPAVIRDGYLFPADAFA